MPLLPCNRLLLASGHEDSSPSYAPRFAAFSWEKLCPCGLAAADDALLIVLEATGITGRRSCSEGLTPRQAARRKELGGWRMELGGWRMVHPGGEPRGVGIRSVHPKPQNCRFGEDVIAGGITSLIAGGRIHYIYGKKSSIRRAPKKINFWKGPAVALWNRCWL